MQMNKGMKGLFRTEYDDYFHEYVYLVCISQDEDKLKQRAALDNPESKVFKYCDESDASEERDEEIAFLEEMHVTHYIIKCVEMI